MNSNLSPRAKTDGLGRLAAAAAMALGLIVFGAGCETTKSPDFAKLDLPKPVGSDVQTLQEGDTLKVSFPGAPSLNTTQVIRRDGRITLPGLGEIKATGITAHDLEKEIIRQFGAELQTKEVTVEVISSGLRIYVVGAVLHPGKIVSERPLTALEAIMEAGGFDLAKANMKAVRITRRESDRTEHFKLNLKQVLSGDHPDSFQLKQSDIVYVPERFQWF